MSSAGFRRQLALTTERLQGYLNQWSDYSEEVKTEGEIEILKSKVRRDLALLERGVEKIGATHAAWRELLGNLSGEALERESKLYDEECAAPNNFLEVAEKGEEVVACLKCKLMELCDTPKTAQISEVKYEGSIGGMDLPRATLPQFHGDPLEWRGFWDSFEAVVGKQPIPPVIKMTHLISSLHGKAKEAVAGLPITNESYQEAVEILKEKFGDPVIVRRHLYRTLQMLPACTERMNDLKRFHEALSKACRQMKTLKEPLDNPPLVMSVLQKLPPPILEEMIKDKTAQDWDMELIKGALDMNLRRREEVASLTDNDRRTSVRPEPHRTSPKLAVNFAAAETHGFRGCELCGQSHSADECMTYRSVKDRKQRILERNLCYRCLRGGHISRNCKFDRPCFFCRRNHHKALCSQREVANLTWRSPVAQPDKKPLASQPQQQSLNAEIEAKCSGKRSHLQPSQRGSDTVPRVEWASQSAVEIAHGIHEGPVRPENASHSPRSMSTNRHASFRANAAVVKTVETNGKLPPSVNSSAEAETTSGEDFGCSFGRGKKVYLPTVRVEVCNPNDKSGSTLVTYALFDSGSQRSFISSSLAKRLGLSPIMSEMISLATFATKRLKKVESQLVHVGLRLREGKTQVIEVNVLPRLVSELVCRTSPQGEERGKRLGKELVVTPEILIGSDLYWEFVGEAVPERLANNLYRVSTKVGSMIGGRLEEAEDEANWGMHIVGELDQAENKWAEVERFWELEAIGVKEQATDRENDYAIQKFDETVEFVDGRYQVCWPWKYEGVHLESNYGLSFGRLKSLLKRLQGDPELLKAYDQNLREQERAGIIEEVPRGNSPDGPVRYFPHQPVITPTKNTTKLRIVFDASAKATKREKSLNECLYSGPALLPDLGGMLLRFRLPKIVLLADVEKAFLQLALKRTERDVTRFLWLDHPENGTLDNNVKTYRFTRVAFGVVSSPFLLGATLRYHLEKMVKEAEKMNEGEEAEIKTLIEQIKENTYVDNVVLCAETSEEAVQMYHKAKNIFDKASMNLREWASNDSLVVSQFREVDKMTKTTTSVLGLGWDRQEDTLTIKLVVDEMEGDVVFTKRKVLSQLSANFDPLGLIAPVLLHGKRFFQTLWKERYQWDEILKPEHQAGWCDIVREWRQYSKFTLPRKVVERSNMQRLQLHAFVDASQHAFAAVIYLRSEDGDAVESQIVFAKTRLKPLRDISIPRLELMACVIGARALTYVEKQLKLTIKRKVVWSDSRCVLAWITSNRALPVFVANRVQELKKYEGIEYKHVRGNENPADIASRGVTPKNLADNKMWWRGPEWLVEGVEQWPTGEDQAIRVDGQEMGNILQTNLTTMLSEQRIEEDWLQRIAARVSTWRKLKGVVAYILRWKKIGNEHRKRQALLSMEDLQEAESKILGTLQNCQFRTLKEALRCNKPHHLRKKLGVIDADGLLQCKGRYKNEDIPAETRWPILLPSKHRITELIIEEAHRESFHQGLQKTLCDVRKRYWVPKGRAVVKRTLKRCLVCRKHEGSSFALPTMPPLPTYRTRRAFPFQHTGVDYFGPILVKDKGQTSKIWGCLWTCLVTRAVHLDTVSNLSAEHFIQAFRRFIARRGLPERIMSDNATTFTAAGKILVDECRKKELKEGMIQYGAEKGLQWDFITSHAPWKGGVYERMVGLVKRSLSKAVGRKVLGVEELQTLLCEIEAVLNSRPLTYVYEDNHDGKVIRPIDFISPHIDILISGCEEQDEESDPSYQPEAEVVALQEKYKIGLRVLDNFWRIWQDEYLLSLREQQRMEHMGSRKVVQREPEVGEVVIISDEGTPRGQWRMGLIISVNRSEDGRIREVVLRTPEGGKLERPLSSLYPLEVKMSETLRSQDKRGDESFDSSQEVLNRLELRSRSIARVPYKQK